MSQSCVHQQPLVHSIYSIPPNHPTARFAEHPHICVHRANHTCTGSSLDPAPLFICLYKHSYSAVLITGPDGLYVHNRSTGSPTRGTSVPAGGLLCRVNTIPYPPHSPSIIMVAYNIYRISGMRLCFIPRFSRSDFKSSIPFLHSIPKSIFKHGFRNDIHSQYLD
jgi:hypothetical protein